MPLERESVFPVYVNRASLASRMATGLCVPLNVDEENRKKNIEMVLTIVLPATHIGTKQLQRVTFQVSQSLN